MEGKPAIPEGTCAIPEGMCAKLEGKCAKPKGFCAIAERFSVLPEQFAANAQGKAAMTKMHELLNKNRGTWSYSEEKNLITATVRITSRDVERVLDNALDWGCYRRVYIFSGVHGTPDGILQVDDEIFFEQDSELAQPGSNKVSDPCIFVKKMPFIQQPQPELLTALNVSSVKAAGTLLILAWCYSANYYDMELK